MWNQMAARLMMLLQAKASASSEELGLRISDQILQED